ncbi:MAG: gephyrin-like molybdotransferase Glp [Hyphomicrobiaceae bacterium]
MSKNAALTVEAALARILADARTTTSLDNRNLLDAAGCVLAAPLVARLTQPPFNASAMDGYAVRAADVASLPAVLNVIGEAAAGHGFRGRVEAGEAVRIFTGAPVPDGADAIIIQENTRRDGTRVTVTEGQIDPEFVRPRGGDFAAGQTLIPSDRRLTARDLTLAAAMGHGALTVRRPPAVAILATGDELVPPGIIPGPDQIVCSNTFGLAALVKAAGGEPRLLGIAGDTRASLEAHVAQAAGADILLTAGGASVGDHDLVAPVLTAQGMTLDFWKIAMRPGKPLMFGRLGPQMVLGLPGNPVSSLICARLFLVPLIRALLGLQPEPHRPLSARAAVKLGANGPRTHYMRATSRLALDGAREVTPVRSQDSSLMSPLAEADCLIVRPIAAPAIPAGSEVPVLLLDF